MNIKNKELWALAQEIADNSSDEDFFNFIQETLIDEIISIKNDFEGELYAELIICLLVSGCLFPFSLFFGGLILILFFALFYVKSLASLLLEFRFPFLEKYNTLEKKFELEKKEKEIQELKEKFLNKK